MREHLESHIFYRYFLILVSSLVILSGCDKELSEIEEHKVIKKLSPHELELVNSTNHLSVDLLKAGYEINNHENFMFSPVSVGMALGMIYNGVGEKEKTQIRHIMGLESLAEKEINKSYNELLSFLQVSNNQLNISYANSLWFSHTMDINEDFRTRVMAYYDAEISELNLKKQSSFDFINTWGSLKTNGNFEILINPAPSITSEIFLINAFGLNTGWEMGNGFFRSKREFTNAKGEKLEVRTLNWEGMHVKLEENDHFSFIEIPFENGQFELSVIQPMQLSSMNEFVRSFTLEDLNEVTENSFEYRANVSLPAINFNSEIPMKKTLSLIGLNELFLPTADLSPSFIDGDKQISEIQHLAKINLSPYVSAATIAKSTFDPGFESIFVNKPFLYFIKDRHTRSVLFAGFYSSPE
ncbi:MAG: hypothetical protein MI975_28155 [Cytophagales bacterium]|nr:hypothetical protein [Cytophagales bacterium]